jgi:hypothetical protein
MARFNRAPSGGCIFTIFTPKAPSQAHRTMTFSTLTGPVSR